MGICNFWSLVVFFVSTMFASAQSQAPIIQWQKCYGGSNIDGATDIQVNSDGGYVVLGYTNSTDQQVNANHGGFDIWVIKIDSLGNLLWQKCLGGSGLDYGSAIRETQDGGYIIIGYTDSNDGDVTGSHGGTSDMWVVKIDNLGQIQWQKCYGGSQSDVGIDILISQNSSGYTLLGFTSSTDGDVQNSLGLDDVWIVDIDSVGNILSEKCYGNSASNYGFYGNLLQTTDKGLFTSCFGHSVPSQGGSQSFQVLKIDSLGTQEFFSTYGGFEEDEPHYSIQTTDEKYLIVGKTRSIDGDVIPIADSTYSNIWIIKVDLNGNLVWTKTLGGGNSEEAYCVLESSTYGLIVGADSESYNGDLTNSSCHVFSRNLWIFELDSTGQNILWKKCYGGSASDYISKMRMVSNGLIVAGSTYSNDGDVSGNHGSQDFWVVKLSHPVTEVPNNTLSNYKISASIHASENVMKLVLHSPKNETADLRLFDLLGRKLVHEQITVSEGENLKLIFTPVLSRGVYILQYRSGATIIALKVLTQD